MSAPDPCGCVGCEFRAARRSRKRRDGAPVFDFVIYRSTVPRLANANADELEVAIARARSEA